MNTVRHKRIYGRRLDTPESDVSLYGISRSPEGGSLMTRRTKPCARWPIIVALLAVIATACGTTVPEGQPGSTQAAGIGTATSGLSAPAAGSATTTPGDLPGSTAGGSPGSGSSGSADGTSTQARPAGPLGPTTATRNDGHARSVVTGPVQVGIEYFDSSQAVALGKSVGYSVSPGYPYDEAKALVAWINRHGGLGGHQVDPVYWQFSQTGSEDTNEQSACQTWTQDHHVAAVIWPNNFSSDDVLVSCLARAGVMLTGGADTYLNSSQLRAEGGYLQTPYMFAGDRMYTRLIDQLVASQWFTPGGKIGILSDDGATYAANVHTVDQALASHGLTASDHATMSTSSPEEDSSDCQSAGLRFAADHVTNIVVVDDGARAFLYCTPAFRSQNYFPKFSITSYDSPSTVQSLIPSHSLSGSAGIGWEPVNDVNPATLNRAGRECLAIMQSGGQNVTTSALTEAIAFAYCDGFFFLHHAYAEAATLAPNAVQQAIANTGSGYLSPITFATKFAARRYDGVAATARLAYQQSCSCFRYSSAPSPTG